jgi:hypothetical protein
MAATFTRVNGVLVDPFQSTTDTGLYPDPQFANAGSYSANLAQPLTTVASQGACYRGMPIGISPSSGMLVPISASGAVYAGVLVDDLTAYVIAAQRKVTFVRKGRVRSYAAGALTIGDPVKADVASTFSGFKKWVTGTDGAELLKGYAYPVDDGSAENGASAASTMAQGDTIFVNLI